MKCPICNADSHVQATRGEMRKRQCAENPSHCFETLEKISHVGQRPQGRPRTAEKTLRNQWAGLV